MVIEWARFELLDGVEERDLLAASEDLQSEFLEKQEGFLRRELVRVGGATWGDLVYWRDEEAVQAAMRSAASSPVCHRYFQLMAGADHDEAGHGIQLLAVRRSYPQP